MPTSDKMPRTVVSVASYGTGESPSATKLTLIGTQLQAAAEAFEKAIGDLRGSKAPYITSVSGTSEQQAQQSKLSSIWSRDKYTGDGLGTNARTLDIASIARLIGPASNLNPRSLDSGTVEESIPAGVHEFALKYPVNASTSGGYQNRYPLGVSIADVVAVTDTALTTYVASPLLMNASGEWTLDAVKGVVYCFTETEGDGTISYAVDPDLFGGGYNYSKARFNVIPDPNADTSDATQMLSITGPVLGVYTITLPVVKQQQSNENQDSVELTDGTTYTDLNYGQQLKLPAYFDGLTAGTELPANSILLKHIPTGTVIDGATYYYNSSSVFDIAGVTLPSTTGSHYIVITTGNDITSSIDDLRMKSRHSHDRSYGEPLVHVQDLTGALSYATDRLGVLSPSEIPGNFAPQYLHREGYDSSDAMNKTNSMAGALRFECDDIPTDEEKGIIFNTAGEDLVIYSTGDDLIIEKTSGTFHTCTIDAIATVNSLQTRGNAGDFFWMEQGEKVKIEWRKYTIPHGDADTGDVYTISLPTDTADHSFVNLLECQVTLTVDTGIGIHKLSSAGSSYPFGGNYEFNTTIVNDGLPDGELWIHFTGASWDIHAIDITATVRYVYEVDV